MSLPRLNPNVVPPGGFVYPLDGIVSRVQGFGSLERIEATTREGLEKRLAEIYAVAGLDQSTVTADLDAYFCARSPDFCDGAATGEPLPASAPLEARIIAWADGLSVEGEFDPAQLDAVHERAMDRASRCVGCVNNVGYAPAGCCGQAAPNAALETKLAGLRGGQDTRFSGELRGCRVLGVDLRTAVWLPLEAIPTAPDERLPVFCWNRGRQMTEAQG